MARESLGSLVVDIRTNTAKFAQGMANSNRTLKRFEDKISNAGRTLKAFAGVAVIGSLGVLAKRFINAGDEIQKLSQQIGASSEALSQYQFIAEQSSVSFQVLTTAWQRQTRRISEATKGMGVAKGALEELGISAESLKNLRPEDQFEIIAKELNKVASQGDKVRLAMQFWDTEGVRLLRVVDEGADGLRKMKEQANAFGVTLSANATAKMALFNKTVGLTGTAFQGLGIKVVTTFLDPTVRGLANLIGLLGQAQGAISGFKAFQETKRLEALYKTFVLFRGQAEFLSKINVFGAFDSSIAVLKGNMDELKTSMAETNEKLLSMQGEYDKGVTSTNAFVQVQQDLLKELENINNELGKTEVATQNASKGMGSLGESAKKTAADIKAAIAELEKATTAEINQDYLDTIEILERIKTPAEKFGDEIERLHELLNKGLLTEDQFGLAAEEALDSLAEKTKETTDQFQELWNSTLATFSQGIGDAFANALFDSQNFMEGLGNLAKSVGKQVISTLVQIGVQRIITGKIFSAAQTSETAVSAANAAATAAAWAPAAAATSIATFGSSALKAAVAIAATFALAKSLSSFATGADSLPFSGPAVVHQGERIIPTRTNKKLESLLSQPGGGVSQPMNINVVLNSDIVAGEEQLEGILEGAAEKIGQIVEGLYQRRGSNAGPLGAG